LKEKALSRAGLRDLWLTFSPAWLRNFVAACGLAHSTAAYGGLQRRLYGVYLLSSILVLKYLLCICTQCLRNDWILKW